MLAIARLLWRYASSACSASKAKASTTSAASDGNFSLQGAIEHCRLLVKNSDHDGYLATLLLSKDLRAAAWAIRALNVELAQVREAVRDTTLGRMRFMFWRDTLDKIAQEMPPPQQPVAIALAYAIHKHRLSIGKLKRIITAREENMQVSQYPNFTALEQYAEGTASHILYLHLDLLRIQSLQADHAASHIGKAIGITNVLRGMPFLLRNRTFYLPSDLCATHNVSTEYILREGHSDNLSSVVFDVATRANDHIITARSHMKDVSPKAIPALVPIIACDKWLKRLEKHNFNLFDSRLHQRDALLPVHLWLAKLTKHL